MPRNPNYSDMAYSFGPGPITPAVRILLYVNIGAYVVSLFFRLILDWFGLQPKDVVEKFRLWQPVTYMFLHARGPSHILFNMLILWMFGVELERTWRTPFFVKYYFVTGVGAGLVSIAACYLPFRATARRSTAQHRRRVGRAVRSAARVRDLLSEPADPDVPALPGPGEVLRHDSRGDQSHHDGGWRRRGRRHRPTWADWPSATSTSRADAAASPRKSSTAI